ncbi:MAG TPA: glucose-6-phosphate isomerase, partial [Gemmatimonadaceae bacterium]|nr:glucose-6-phosphate isomerase [Gemmatimonadaceae bacterium]
IRIDYTNMLAGAVSGGIDDDSWADAAERFRAAHAAVVEQHARGTLGFLDLPDDTTLHHAVTDFVAARRGHYDDVVVLGIGGSALGPIALRTALRSPGWNTLGDAERGGWPRLHVLDNVDPRTIGTLLDRLRLDRALFVVTSKSGSTAETMAQFLVVHERLRRALGDGLARQLVFVTDPAAGALRALAGTLGVPALDVPSNVGGRFSVLTPVGLLPAALAGIDTGELLAGAADMRTRCAPAALAHNPAGVFATLQWLADTRAGRHVHVLMPYSDALRDLADWFVQLWAESLGKIDAAGRSVGPTPLAALGATDQHSQVQLFMEGPHDKTVCFVAVEAREADVAIPHAFPDVRELAYLGGHTLGELLDVERRATAGALARRGRPNMTITVERVDAWHLGGMFMLFELATAYAGHLYGVNAFDQPGVELGKQFTYAMLGRADADAARAEWERLPRPDPRFVV